MKKTSNGNIIYARTDGIWALNLASGCNSYYNWSTGSSNSILTVSPTQSTTYYCTFSNGINSCIDSVKLTVIQPSSTSENIIACSSYIWHGVTYTTGGVKTWTGTNKFGCDSVVTLNLIINQASISSLNVSKESTIPTLPFSYALSALSSNVPLAARFEAMPL